MRVHERTEQDMGTSQFDFSPRLSNPSNASVPVSPRVRRGREGYPDTNDAPPVFTEFLRESVRKRVDLSATGHSM